MTEEEGGYAPLLYIRKKEGRKEGVLQDIRREEEGRYVAIVHREEGRNATVEYIRSEEGRYATTL